MGRPIVLVRHSGDALADGLTKGAVDREALVLVCEKGVWCVTGQAPESKRLLDK